jgi:hypothetical protein
MAIVRLDKMQASYNGNLESVVHNADLKNGSVIVLGDLVAGEREIKQVVVPTSVLAGAESVLLVAAPEMDYDPRKQLKDFVNPANEAVRAYHLTRGDIFTVTDDMIVGSSVVGQFASADAGFQVKASTTKPATRTVLKVIEKTTLGFDGLAATAFQVISA